MRSEAGSLSGRLSGVLRGTNETNNRHRPEENCHRSAAHHDEGCQSARAPRKPQWDDAHGSLNDILFSMSQCISVESLVKT